MAKRTYRTEFPDFGELDVRLPGGFEDTSWHNDAMPSFTRQLSPPGVTPEMLVVIWVDYADPACSEVAGGSYRETTCRFTAQVLRGGEPLGDVVFGSNSWDLLVRWAEAACHIFRHRP